MENLTPCNQNAKSLVAQVEESVTLRLVDPDGERPEQWMFSAHTDIPPLSGLIRRHYLVADSEDSSTCRIAVVAGNEGVGGSEEIYSLVMGAGEPETWCENDSLGPDQRERDLVLAGGLAPTLNYTKVKKAERSRSAFQLIYGGRSYGSMAQVAEASKTGIGEVRLMSRPGHGHRDFADVIDIAPEELLIRWSGPEGVVAAGEECYRTPKVSKPLPTERFAGLTTIDFGALDNVGEGVKFQIEPNDGDAC
ncbi:MAG: hypothetical protein M0Z96_05950 [Actinomycetota bacterium]|nr:hypothetical protein [Actinomycetota bacterium]